jgi:hypothetical protein
MRMVQSLGLNLATHPSRGLALVALHPPQIGINHINVWA